ncbi:dATP/dGTP diphosphohydrolase domain-containing protein [Mycobacterium sp. AZCC_0083]|uniref:dATP/dGTP diphosphohydrolase domain-containing protein n=1 Tax=Mycobacterium sp. AZCC_0083 TaxID=2735882 RepID=UPI00160DDCA4|nr:dATP/dGTP diphosphohydrolase domain-containing protein [Mycobacterium sp. AZCC_0083]MBB5167142.1 hypothetical protein [Mycobacterium sp. AZCC_0083]
MSTNEVITTSSTGAQKAGNDERHDLVPIGPLRELATHYGVGSHKYEDRNWELGYEWSKSYAALKRHLSQFWGGEDIDAETGSKHIIAVAWHAFALAQFMDQHPEFDNRPTTLAAKREADAAIKFATGGVIASRFDGSINLMQALNDGNLTVSYSPESSVSIIDHPAEVDNLDEQWARAYEWVEIDWELHYRWFRNGHDGTGWYFTDPEDPDEGWEWSYINGDNSRGKWKRVP